MNIQSAFGGDIFFSCAECGLYIMPVTYDINTPALCFNGIFFFQFVDCICNLLSVKMCSHLNFRKHFMISSVLSGFTLFLGSPTGKY